MRKIIAIFLLLQIVTNSVFAEELVKIPRLFTHYFHHAEEKRDVHDFIDFLQQHYSNHQNEMQGEQESYDDDDCNLPFKHCGNCCVSVHMPIIGFISNNINSCFNYVQIINVGFVNENERIESLDICTIWQPPKLV